MLNKDFFYVFRHEFSNEARVPEFASNAKVFAASPQCGGLAALDCCWDTFWREVVLLASSDRYEPGKKELLATARLDQLEYKRSPSKCHQSILSRHSFCSHNRFTSGC